ncbi:MAG: hypothetical protein AAGF72_13210 [Pseudomonadota bacterium]
MLFSDDNNTRWLTLREQGPVRFVIVQGVLKWGFGTAIAWLALMTIFTGSQINYAVVVPRALMIFPAFGVVFGASLWLVFDRLGRRA